MLINKAKLASGDRNELLRLARSIKPTVTLSKQDHPMASQFFADDPVGVTHLSTDELASSMAGEVYNERIAWIDALASGGYEAIALNRPKAAGDVSQIGTGAGSGWTAPKPSIASGAKAERALLLHKIAKATNPSAADTATSAATLKSLCAQLLGADVGNFDTSTLKAKLTKTIRSRPDLGLRLTKALGITKPDSAPDLDLNLEQLIALGATVTKTGGILRISI